jgi:hypothetical protein
MAKAKAKDKDANTAKKAKKGEAAPPGQIRLADHPRARRQIATAKGWGGLVGFVLVGWLSHKAGVPAFQAGLRALAGGVGLYVLAWAGAVAVWREVAVAEVVRARRRAIAEAELMAAAAQEHAAQRSA